MLVSRSAGGPFVDLRTVWEHVSASSVETVVPEARCTYHLSADRPVYRPGETIYYRTVAVDAFTKRPCASRGRSAARPPFGVDLKDATGTTVAGSWESSGSISLDAGLAGGKYTLSAQGGQAVRDVEVRAFTAPPLLLDVDFEGRTFDPSGDTVRASVSCRDRQQEGCSMAALEAVVRDGDREVASGRFRLDGRGEGAVELPFDGLGAADAAVLHINLRHGGHAAGATRTLPLLRQDLRVSVFPEGGDLVAGLPTRVYVEVSDGAGNPINAQGQICEDGGACVASVAASHVGRGKSSRFAPKAGARYHLSIAGTAQEVPLPRVKNAGATLLVEDAALLSTAPLSALVSGSSAGAYDVLVSLREQFVALRRVSLPAGGSAQVVFPADALDGAEANAAAKDLQRSSASPAAAIGGSGVYRVTVFRDGAPLAERLVFRRPAPLFFAFEVLNNGGSAVFEHGDEVQLKVSVLEESGSAGQLVPSEKAVLFVGATDVRSLEMQRDELKQPLLPTQALLEQEVWDLRDARGMLLSLETQALSPEDPSGAPAPMGADGERVDLLLGTQGWRRFAHRNTTLFLEDDARGRPENDPRPDLTDAAALRERKERLFALHAFAGEPVLMMAMRGGPEVRAGVEKREYIAAEALPMVLEAMDDAAMAEGGGLAVPVMAAAAGADEGALDAAQAAFAAVAEPFGAAEEPFDAAEEPFEPFGAVEEPFDGAEEPPPVGLAPKRKKRARRGLPRYSRVFAHDVRTFSRKELREGIVRSDFDPTLLWLMDLTLDGAAGDSRGDARASSGAPGEATLRFGLSDSLSSFVVSAEALGASGAMGAAQFTIGVKMPLAVSASAPRAAVVGDEMLLPVVVEGLSPAKDRRFHLRRAESPTPVRLSCEASGGVALLDAALRDRVLQHRESTRLYVPLRIDGAGELRVSAATEGERAQKDAVALRVSAAQSGFPMSVSCSGFLSGGESASCDVALPENVVGAVSLAAAAFPNPVGGLLRSAEALVREPHGCFEQTSSTTYPMLLAAKALRRRALGGDGGASALYEDAVLRLERGYARLRTFESKGGGYEWFGGDPGHEALSAMGLLQFAEYSAVLPPTADAADNVERLRGWLLGRLKGDGSGAFERNAAAMDSYGSAPQDVTDAYIMYSVCRAGRALPHPLPSRAVDEAGRLAQRLLREGGAASDAYLLGLLIGISQHCGVAADGALEALLRLQQEDGSFAGARATITSSGPRDRGIEATALALLAATKALRDGGGAEREELLSAALKALRFLGAQGANGRYGATQATVLTLEAVLAFQEYEAAESADGALHVSMSREGGGAALEASASYARDAVRVDVDVGAMEEALQAGAGEAFALELRREPGAKGRLPYSVDVNFRVRQPPSAAGAPLVLSTDIASERVGEMEATAITIRVENAAAEGVAMAMAVVGVPSGLAVRAERLEELLRAGALDLYEIVGADLRLYWRGIAPSEVKSVRVDAMAEVPGTFTGAASRAYPYYDESAAFWVPGMRVEIDTAAAAAAR